MTKITAHLLSALVALGAMKAVMAADVRFVTVPAGASAPVSITLIPRQGNVGRDNAFYDNYRPQVQFLAEKQLITCTVRIPESTEKVEPGQTSDAILNCSEKFKIRQDQKSFVVIEGGRKVAVGIIK